MAPPVSVIQDAVVDDVHAHEEVVVTVMVPEPPPAGTFTASGDTVKEHDALGSVTMKLLPAMVSIPVRDVPVVFAAAVKPTLPLPLPLAPLVMVIHDAPLVAVHAQPVAVVTDTVPVPPAAGMA